MLEITGTEAWKTEHAGGMIGLLEVSHVQYRNKALLLDKRKREIEAALVEQYGDMERQELIALPVMAAYRKYYKRFKKTYHVQLQVESITKKGKQLPNVSPLVDANFMAEVETFVLTAGHDIAKLKGKVLIAGHCAIEEVSPLLIKQLKRKNVYLSGECNDLCSTAEAMFHLMKVNPIKLVPINPVLAVVALITAKLMGSKSRVPNPLSHILKRV